MSIPRKILSLSSGAKIRYALLFAGILLFLPPLSLLPQIFGETRFCGTWCMKMFLSLKPSSNVMAASFMGVSLVAAILASTFLFGRLWCARLCPVGGISELGSKLLPDKIKIDCSSIPAPAVRYGYFLVFLLAPLLGIGSLGCKICNFSIVPHFLSAPFDDASLAFLCTTTGGLSLSFFAILGPWSKGGRGYCNFMCPVGALDSLSNAFGAWLGFRRFKVNKAACVGCGACRSNCPMWAITSGNGKIRQDQFSCISCGKCRDECPGGAIRYG